MDKSRTLKQDVDFKGQRLAKTSGRRRALEKERALAQRAQCAPRNDLLPDMDIVKVRIGDLRPSPHRTRRLSEDEVGRLMSSIGDEFASWSVLSWSAKFRKVSDNSPCFYIK